MRPGRHATGLPGPGASASTARAGRQRRKRWSHQQRRSIRGCHSATGQNPNGCCRT